MGFNPEDYVGQDEHFSEQEAKDFFDELEENNLPAIENKFQSLVSNAEAKMEKFCTGVLGSTVAEEEKKKIEEARSSMKNEFAKIKKWFSDRVAEMKSKPDEAKNKVAVFKEEFFVQWADFKKFISNKTKSIRNLNPATAKKEGFDAEEFIMKAQSTVHDVIVPKIKEFVAMSKAAAAGALKGVKDMKKNKDESDKK